MFTLEPITLEGAGGGTSSYKVKGAPVGIGFRERDGKLQSVEAMALAIRFESDSSWKMPLCESSI